MNRKFFSGVGNQRGEALVLEDIPTELGDSPFVRRFVSGEDLAKFGFARRERFAVVCDDDDLGEVRRRHSATARWLETNVGVARGQGLPRKYRRLETTWWQMFEHRADLFRTLRESGDYAPIVPIVSKWVIAVPGPTSWCYTNKIGVLLGAPDYAYTFLNSSVGSLWVERYSGRMKGPINVSVNGALKTVPWGALDDLDPAPGREFASLLLEWCQEHGQGATDFLNEVHNQHTTDEACLKARTLFIDASKQVGRVLGVGEVVHEWRAWEDDRERLLLAEEYVPDVLDSLLRANLRAWGTERGMTSAAVDRELSRAEA